MAPLPPKNPSQLLDAISARLQHEGWRWKRGKDSRQKLVGRCLFHEERTPSADFYPDDGWYYCHACAERYDLDEIAQALDIAASTLETSEGQPPGAGLPRMHHSTPNDALKGYHNKFGWPVRTYFYRFPDGTLSHLKHRYETGSGKTFLIQSPDGRFRRPDAFWPIYGLQTLPPGMNYVLVEGEKAQEATNQAAQLHQGIPIFALTCGSAADMQSADNRKQLVQLLQALKANHVLIWPDNDKPGREWARALHIQLVASGIRAATATVNALGLPEHAGCDDFLAQGGDLDSVFTREFQQAGGYTVDDIVEQAVVTRSGLLLVPGTRILAPIQDETIETAFYRMTHDPNITPKIKQRLRNELRSKSYDSDIEVFYRRWHDQHRDTFAWRAIDHGFAYAVDRGGLRGIQDPANALLLVPPGAAQWSTSVDQSGQRSALEDLCAFFGVESNLEILEGWLLCALVGLQTPILLLRGEAGSGKTTLAKALVGILEPTVPQVRLTQSVNRDERALVNGLRQSMAVLIDNVSGMPAESEDLLSTFVTGYGVLHRPLYGDRVENIAMQRAIVITTTNWNMSKGDLVSRAVAIRTHAYDRYKDEDQVEAFLNPLIEKIRGYLFERACWYYQQIYINPNGTSSLRLAGLSRVLRALGYDATRIERQLALNRVRVAGETDSWLNAVANWLSDLDLREGQSRDVRLEEIKGSIEGLTDQFLPSNQKFAAFLYEAAPQFRDYGFTLVRGRTNQMRFWTVKKIREMEDAVDPD